MICLHHEVCDNLKVGYTKVNRVSLVFKVNQIRKEIENLKKEIHHQRETEYTFEIPQISNEL